MEILSHNTIETQNLAFRLGELAQPGTLVLLRGALGAGKTSFVQGLAQGLGIRGIVNSPTFTIVREYQGRLPLYHFDLYRLEEEGELWDLGLDEYLAAPAVVAMEWPDLALELLPPERLEISIQSRGAEERALTLVARGEYHKKLAEELNAHAGAGN